MEFSKKLVNLRKTKNITQEDVGNALHVSRQTISKWETGKSLPSLDMVKAIADFFEVPAAELISCESAEELAYRNTQQLQKLRKKGRILTAAIAATLIVSILALTFGLLFGFLPALNSREDEDTGANAQFIGVFFDLASNDSLRDGEITTAQQLVNEKKPIVYYSQTESANGKKEYRYKVYGIRHDKAFTGPYATFEGTLFFDPVKLKGKYLQLYEIYREGDNLKLSYVKRVDSDDGSAVSGYDRDDGASKSDGSLRAIRIKTAPYKTHTKIVLTEKNENFDTVKTVEVPLDGMNYELDENTCYVTLTTFSPDPLDPSRQIVLTNLYTTAELSKLPSLWLHANDENGFCNPFIGFLKFSLPSRA